SAQADKNTLTPTGHHAALRRTPHPSFACANATFPAKGGRHSNYNIDLEQAFIDAREDENNYLTGRGV
ncbi:MAG: hypothetical protein IKT47_00605, partial [Oscillospiraceae bacterium]|nr:hypothetical protein [Oscillospiraceae bacterium]